LTSNRQKSYFGQQMMSSRFRIVASLLLVVSLFSFSGAAQACLQFVDPAAVQDSCCPPGDDRTSDAPVSPCSSPECQCLGCSGALIQTRIYLLGAAVVSISRMPFDKRILPSGFTSRIDYPPEFA
jgi:hypothetical protein